MMEISLYVGLLSILCLIYFELIHGYYMLLFFLCTIDEIIFILLNLYINHLCVCNHDILVVLMPKVKVNWFFIDPLLQCFTLKHKLFTYFLIILRVVILYYDPIK